MPDNYDIYSIRYEDEVYESILSAAELIDKEKYDEFEHMHKAFDISDNDTKSMLVDEVQTLSGIKYLEQKGLIPENYFTDTDRAGEPVFSFASPEQIDFYVEHGVDVNATASHVNATTLDYAISRCSSDTVEKLVNVGCLSYRGKEIGFSVDYLNNEEAYTKLKNATVLLKHGFKITEDTFTNLSKNEHKDLLKKFPDLMTEIMSHDSRTDAQKAKDRIKDRIEQSRGMTADIKKGMAITRAQGYKHFSRTSIPQKGAREE